MDIMTRVAVKRRVSELLSKEAASDYVIQNGDTLSGIAKKNKLNMRDIIRWNGISNPNKIIAGKTLKLSPPEVNTVPRSAAWKAPADFDIGRNVFGTDECSGEPDSVYTKNDAKNLYSYYKNLSENNSDLRRWFETGYVPKDRWSVFTNAVSGATAKYRGITDKNVLNEELTPDDIEDISNSYKKLLNTRK